MSLLLGEMNNERLNEGEHKMGERRDLDASDLFEFSGSSANGRLSVASKNSNKDLFDDFDLDENLKQGEDEELYKDSIDSRLERFKMNDALEGEGCLGVGGLSAANNIKMRSQAEDVNKSPKSNIMERLENKAEENRRISVLSNDQNSLTDDSMFNVNNSFGSNMANYSAYDSVHEIGYLGSNQKIENHENVLLNRMIDNQGIYNDINTLCETLSTTINENFQTHNKEIQNLSEKVDNIESKLSELISLFEARFKPSPHPATNHGSQFTLSNDMAMMGTGAGGIDYNIDSNYRNFGQNSGNMKSSQLFANNAFPFNPQRSNINRGEGGVGLGDNDLFTNPNLSNNSSRMNSNSIRESQREAEKKAEMERLRKLEAERKKKEEAERRIIEEERRRQKEEAERKMRADVKRKEIMDSLFACQTNDHNPSSSEKKPSLFGDESSNCNSRRNLFDD